MIFEKSTSEVWTNPVKVDPEYHGEHVQVYYITNSVSSKEIQSVNLLKKGMQESWTPFFEAITTSNSLKVLNVFYEATCVGCHMIASPVCDVNKKPKLTVFASGFQETQASLSDILATKI